MNILFLTNNLVSLPLADWLQDRGETVRVFYERLNAESLPEDRPELIISYNYRYIIRNDILSLFPHRVINLHISLLPWNRGADPNIWSFLDDSPKGITIHKIDSGIDTGDILLQREIFFDIEKETLESSYAVLHQEIQQLFRTHWEDLRYDRIPAKRQPKGEGSLHSLKDLGPIRDCLSYGDTIQAFLDKVNKAGFRKEPC